MRLLKIFWGLWGVVSVDSFIGSTAPVTGLRRLSLGTGGGPGAAAVRRGRSSSEVRMAAAIVGRGRIGSALYVSALQIECFCTIERSPIAIYRVHTMYLLQIG